MLLSMYRMKFFLVVTFALYFFGIEGTKEICPHFMNINVEDATQGMLTATVDVIVTKIRTDIARESRTTDLMRKKELNSLNVAELRKTAEYSLFTMIALCKDGSISCKLCDIFFIATETAMGDENCYLTCTYDQAVAKANDLPTSHTFETYIDVGLKIESKANTDSKKEALIRQGMEQSGKQQKKSRKRILPLLPVAFVAMKAILTVGSMAAIGWAANRAEQNGQASGTVAKIASPLIKVGQASGSCFMADSIVNVQLPSMEIVRKTLSTVEVGDMIESLDEATGKSIYTPVYYMAHSNEKLIGSLLSVHYRDETKGISSLGISGRHLIYATKENTTITTAPTTNPIQAKDLNTGDYVWVMNRDNQLKPQQVVDVIPFQSEVRHPLTENHHIIVDGVHASVHVLNEALYRAMTSPLRALYNINPEWNKSTFVERMVQFVESVKEPIFNEGLVSSVAGLSMIETISM